MSTHTGYIPYNNSCGTQKHTHSKRYISSMPIGVWG